MKLPEPRRGRKKIFPFSNEAMEIKLARGQAHPIAIRSAGNEDNPVINVLSGHERVIWRLRAAGWRLHEIASELGMVSPEGRPREDQVTRTYQAIREKIQFVIAVRNELIRRPGDIDKFLAGHHCGRCTRKIPTDGIRGVI